MWLRRLLGPLARLLVTVGNAVTPGKGFRDGPFQSEAELREFVDLAGDNALIEDEERDNPDEGDPESAGQSGPAPEPAR